MNVLAYMVSLAWASCCPTPGRIYSPPRRCEQGSLCRGGVYDPRWWFASHPNVKDKARAVCKSCVVSGECLEYALSWPTYGIWGGLDQREREQIRKARRRSTIPLSTQGAVA
jgi:hypothetical protein